MSYFTQMSYSDTGALDAFSRLRTSTTSTVFSTQAQYNAAGIQMEIGATGTGVTPTHDANTRMITVSATAGSGTAFIQSYQYSPYIPGKSQFIAETFVLGTAVASAIVDVGYFDASNGIILRQNGTTNYQIILRTSTGGSVSDANIVAQSAWNIDTMLSGTGPSRKTIDLTKAQILIIDLQFLGMGRVRVGFDIDGVVYYVHEFKNANNLSVPYMQTATLPVGMLITASSTATTKTAYWKCATVQTESGKTEDVGFHFGTGEGTVTAASGARTHILSVRPKTTFNGITNRELFELHTINIANTGAKPVFWELVVGAAFSVAPTWADVNTTYSACESGTAGTFSNLTTGIVVASGYVDPSSGSTSTEITSVSANYPITLNRAGAVRAMGTYSLLVTGIGGSSDCRATLNFHEVR